MGNFVVISVYSKNSDPDNSTFEASQTVVGNLMLLLQLFQYYLTAYHLAYLLK